MIVWVSVVLNGIGLLFMVTDLSNICAVVIFRIKVWLPLSRLLQPVTIRNSAIQGLHLHIGDHIPLHIPFLIIFSLFFKLDKSI